MKSQAVVLSLVAVLVVATIGTVLYLRGAPQTTSSSTRQEQVPLTTLEDLVAGKYPTAYDRSGAGGVEVTVRGLMVISVENESDGDWHVKVTDGRLPSIITEITPSYQLLLGRPVPGEVIDETGVVFCDVQHENESWHGSTCWEVHPVTQWQLSSGDSVHATTTQGTSGIMFAVGYSMNMISNGANQTVYVKVMSSGSPLSGAVVSIEVTNIGGPAGSLTCTTSSEGTCSAALPTGSDTIIGTYGVRVTAEGAVYYSAFEVIGAPD